MSCVSSYSESETITSEELLELANETADPRDSESIIAMSPLLHRLANNKTMILEHINNQLALVNDRKRNSSVYSSQTFYIGRLNNFAIRANIWFPIKDRKKSAYTVAEHYAYFSPHNHNFHLLVANYFGPGYVTTLYDIDPERIAGYRGEHVEMKNKKTIQLTKGSVLFMESESDVHVQFPPDSVSASLNLIPTKVDHTRPQYIFDERRSLISGFVSSGVEELVRFLVVCGMIGDNNTLTYLTEIANKHPCDRVRLRALHAGLNIDSDFIDVVQRIASRDKSPMIRNYKDYFALGDQRF